MPRKADKDHSHKRYTKKNLPSKICQACDRPFNWRKKWAKVWGDVKYCSKRCQNERNKGDL